jgi:4-hydroxy-2-oxoheptanedioate aldolase
MGNPKIDEARRRVAEVARKHGKIAGTVGGTGNLKELYEMGYRFVNLGADVVALGQYFTKIADDAKAIRDSL